MPQSIYSFNSDGYQIILLPLKIKSLGVGGIKVNKVYIENNTTPAHNYVDYVFKIKDRYCDYSNVSSVGDSMSYNSDYMSTIPEGLNHQDFHIEKNFTIEDTDEVFDFSVSFEPISAFTTLGSFESTLYIEYNNVETLGGGTVILYISGECNQKLIENIDGVPVSSAEYNLSIHGNIFNEFIQLG
jgi:hypothetical protein